MKMRDAKSRRFEMRMTEEEYQLLQLTAEYINRSPTEFVRLLLNGAFTEMRDVIERGEKENDTCTDCEISGND